MINKLIENIETQFKGQNLAVKKILAAFFSNNHVLLEDVPGTGKTTLAKVFAEVMGVDYNRIQFTPDLLPSDILGSSIYSKKKEEFIFNKGPIFTDILLADEINRASPRTQSALLEAMAERQVTIENNHYNLSPHFFVIATENPIDFEGTYELPEAQLDRFCLKFSLGYVSFEDELEILKGQFNNYNFNKLPITEIERIKNEIKHIEVSHKIYEYIIKLIRATRVHDSVQHGASSRAAISLLNISKAYAYVLGNKKVYPDHIHHLIYDCLSHRLVLKNKAVYDNITSSQVIDDILKTIEIPK